MHLFAQFSRMNREKSGTKFYPFFLFFSQLLTTAYQATLVLSRIQSLLSEQKTFTMFYVQRLLEAIN